MKRLLAFDIGASSGRAIVGTLNDNHLTLDEIYRFPNNGIRRDASFLWNISGIYSELLNGLKEYVIKYGNRVAGIGIDTWGVDFALLDKNDELVGQCYHYRDSRTKGMLNYMFEKVPKEEIFKDTGIQFMEINTSTQLYSLIHDDSPQLARSETFLMIPDYLNYLLCGKKCSEYSIATTSQLFNPNTFGWAQKLIEKLGLEFKLFQKIVPSGSVLGELREEIAQAVGLNKNTNIIAPACHDTGSAIAAVPVDMRMYESGEWAYLSSGTWSLLGVELNKPIINVKSLEFNFTNEGGVENTVRFLKNVTGLWIIQECKKEWKKQGLEHTWEQIISCASEAKPFQCFINPDDPLFHNPPDMIKAIQNYCEMSDQIYPKTIGEVSRVIFESLAFRYKQVTESMEKITNKKVKILYIIGGGSSNQLLNQFTANSLNIPIKAGPLEATAIGNILIQAKAIGLINHLDELRNIVIRSFPITDYYPEDVRNWMKGYEKYLKFTS
ncbi:MAG: rhamnulokinase [Candidatus Lokiarchaeota archaeon]|nr:rhamnulokinase [Candidatus Lokiarchaeota archaeon]